MATIIFVFLYIVTFAVAYLVMGANRERAILYRGFYVKWGSVSYAVAWYISRAISGGIFHLEEIASTFVHTVIYLAVNLLLILSAKRNIELTEQSGGVAERVKEVSLQSEDIYVDVKRMLIQVYLYHIVIMTIAFTIDISMGAPFPISMTLATLLTWTLTAVLTVSTYIKSKKQGNDKISVFHIIVMIFPPTYGVLFLIPSVLVVSIPITFIFSIFN